VQNDKRILGLSPFAFLVAVCATVKFAIHILTGSNYGYFCDELYTIALSKHLAFGYIDLPPLVPLLVAASRAVLGESLLALHIVPALAGSATLVFACLITRELSGKLFATGLTALGFLIAPVWLILDSFFCYDSIDQLVLAIFLFLLVRYIRTGNRKLWVTLGLTAGIACMTKTTILYLGPGLVIALFASKYRRDLLTPWPWIGVGLFLVILSPYLLWEHFNEWPTLEYWAHYGSRTLYHASIPEYFLNIVLTMNPVLFPLLGIGLYRIFRRFDGINYSFLGIMFMVTLILLFTLHARAFMLAELFIPLIASGSVFMEEKLSGSGWRKGVRVAIVTCMAAGGILVTPSAVPMLPVKLLPSYAKAFGFLYKPVKDFNSPKSDYPQEFSNRIGWDELVQTVAAVYDTLPPEDRKKAGIWADWYGPAGAIDVLGPEYGLPHAVCGHLTYYLWGPGYSWDVMILVTGAIEVFRPYFVDVELKAVINNEFAMPYNPNRVYLCRTPMTSPGNIWSHLKNY
jgi:4-amino-4-deoxy-L-arabinose transferase-like glycosyltransferase